MRVKNGVLPIGLSRYGRVRNYPSLIGQYGALWIYEFCRGFTTHEGTDGVSVDVQICKLVQASKLRLLQQSLCFPLSFNREGPRYQPRRQVTKNTKQFRDNSGSSAQYTRVGNLVRAPWILIHKYSKLTVNDYKASSNRHFKLVTRRATGEFTRYWFITFCRQPPANMTRYMRSARLRSHQKQF